MAEPTVFREYPMVPVNVEPDVPHWVNLALKEIDRDVQEVADTITTRFLAAVSSANTYADKVGKESSFIRRDLLPFENLDLLVIPGLYRVTSYTIANSLKGAPRQPNTGVVEVTPGAGNGVQHRYIFANGFNQPRVVSRSGSVVDAVGTFGPWVPLTDLPEPLAAGDELRTITTPGKYSAGTAAVAGAVIGLPEAVKGQPGTLKVDTTFTSATAYRTVQEWTTLPYAAGQPPRTFMQSFTNSSPGHAWIERAYVVPPVANAAQPAPVGHRRALLEQASRLRHGGVIGIGDRTAVALSFDHGFANYRDYLLPHLIRLGLPHSVAVNPGTLGAGESDGVGFTELQRWALAHGVELVNHSGSHADAVTPAEMETAILGALATIRAGAPKTIVDAYIMPGVSGTGYDGFNAGTEYDKWWNHPAGRMIMDSHAVVTGALAGQAVPMSGTPVQGVDRMGVDAGSWASVAEDRIRSLRGSGMGMHIFNHPSKIENGITAARIVSFLEFLAAERNAGRVEVLTVSGFAWASADTTRRFDLTRNAWTDNAATVALAPLHEWARGGQWQLCVDSETAAADVTLRVTDGAALNTSVTLAVPAGGTARLTFGIPTDAATLTLTAATSAGTLTGHRVQAV